MKKLVALLIICCISAVATGNGHTTCPSSGNKPLTSTQIFATSYTLQPDAANTGLICWGGNSVTTSTTACLSLGMTYTAPVKNSSNTYDLSQVFIACTVSADSVNYVIP